MRPALSTGESALKPEIGVVGLWSLAVGLVISGEYFGWSYGWGAAGTVGFLYTTLLVAVLYVAFIFSFTELTTAIPRAGGPFAYASRAFGPFGGLIAGYATLVEFALAPPAIAAALGAYTHFQFETVPALAVGIVAFIIFVGLNIVGVRQAVRFELFVTVLAVAELVVFMAVVAPGFQLDAFLTNPMPAGIRRRACRDTVRDLVFSRNRRRCDGGGGSEAAENNHTARLYLRHSHAGRPRLRRHDLCRRRG